MRVKIPLTGLLQGLNDRLQVEPYIECVAYNFFKGTKGRTLGVIFKFCTLAPQFQKSFHLFVSSVALASPLHGQLISWFRSEWILMWVTERLPPNLPFSIWASIISSILVNKKCETLQDANLIDKLLLYFILAMAPCHLESKVKSMASQIRLHLLAHALMAHLLSCYSVPCAFWSGVNKLLAVTHSDIQDPALVTLPTLSHLPSISDPFP